MPKEQSEPLASYLEPVAATGPPDAASFAVGGTPGRHATGTPNERGLPWRLSARFLFQKGW